MMGRLTQDYMNGLKTLRKIDVDYTEPDSMAKLEKVTDKDVRTWLDSLDSHFLVVLGATKAPLAYVTCEEGVMPPGQDLSGDYANIQEEMIHRAPHGTPEFSTNRTTVWDILRQAVHGTPAYTWIKTHASSRSGREAYFALKHHYLGTAANEMSLGVAEAAIENTFYKGEKDRFTFENFVTRHPEAYNSMEEVPGYAVPDDGTRVRKRLSGIHNVKLDAAKAAIRASQDLRNDFEAAINLLRPLLALGITLHKTITSVPTDRMMQEEEAGVMADTADEVAVDKVVEEAMMAAAGAVVVVEGDVVEAVEL
jgi:hypothetical protein